MRCFFSADKFFSEDYWSNSAKLATLWFDEIILQAPSKGLTELLAFQQAKKDHWSKQTLDQVNHVWSDVHKYIPDYDFVGLTLLKEGVQPPSYEGHYGLTKKVRDILIEEWKQQNEKYRPFCPVSKFEISDDFEVNRQMVESIDIWFSLRSNMDCTFLSGLTEDRVLRKLLSKPSQKSAFDVFSEFTPTMLPDITNWSWDKIMGIRNNPDIISFREKITSIWNSLDTGDVECATNILKEQFYGGMEEFFNKYRPNPSAETSKFVFSNIPLPIPNPYSIYTGLKDIERADQDSQKYGWMYFITGLRNG